MTFCRKCKNWHIQPAMQPNKICRKCSIFDVKTKIYPETNPISPKRSAKGMPKGRMDNAPWPLPCHTLLYIRMWRFRLRLYNDLRVIYRLNEQVIERISDKM